MFVLSENDVFLLHTFLTLYSLYEIAGMSVGLYIPSFVIALIGQ